MYLIKQNELVALRDYLCIEYCSTFKKKNPVLSFVRPGLQQENYGKPTYARSVFRWVWSHVLRVNIVQCT